MQFFFLFPLPFQNNCVYLSRQTEMMPFRLQRNQGDGHMGHGDRYIGSLFRVDEPVPDDSKFIV